MRKITMKLKNAQIEDNCFKMGVISNMVSDCIDVYELNRIMHALALTTISIDNKDDNNKFTYKFPFKLR